MLAKSDSQDIKKAAFVGIGNASSRGGAVNNE
jgi:hypothetical protein